jgi:hypothetical protein
MKKKKLLISESPTLVFSDEKIKINKIGNEWFFEVGKEITSDLGEAVSLMMRICDPKSDVWNLNINPDMENITPEKSLFWLTGGLNEWRNLENYNRPWCDCYLEFQEEFGLMIVGIIRKSKKLIDVRDGFNKYLNLPILYDFAVSKNILR